MTESYWWEYLSRITTKPTKWHVRPAKTQIRLGIRPVWSGSSLSAWWKHGPLATHWGPSLIRVFAVCMMKAWTLSYPLSAQSDQGLRCPHAQADLSLCWVHRSVCWFWHDAAHFDWKSLWCPLFVGKYILYFDLLISVGSRYIVWSFWIWSIIYAPNFAVSNKTLVYRVLCQQCFCYFQKTRSLSYKFLVMW